MSRYIDGHLDSTTLQALLDGGLSTLEAHMAGVHLAGCPACQEALESWRPLFERLESLGRKVPSPTFRTDVLERFTAEHADQEARFGTSDHLTSDVLLDLLDRRLEATRRSRVQEHVDACPRCHAELRSWRHLLGSLDRLGHLPVPDGFKQRAYRRFKLSREMGVRARAGRLVRRVLPATRKGWATVAGIATAPATVVAAAIWVLFSNPLVTPQALLSFAEWKVGDAAAALTGGLADLLGQSLGAFRAFQVIDFVSGSPAAAGLAVLLFAVLSVSALWILYRNLFTNPRTSYAGA